MDRRYLARHHDPDSGRLPSGNRTEQPLPGSTDALGHLEGYSNEPCHQFSRSGSSKRAEVNTMAEQLEREQPHWQIWQQLPLHPQPAALESLTSYIMRVAQANGLQTSAEFVAAAGTGYGWQTLRSFPDGSITSVLGLTTLTGCTQTNLEAMTFLPFGRHFGRANSTRTLRRFLQSSLAPYLRYFPVCLAERGFPYYRLPWRFLILSGCLTHHCQFLDHCV